MKLTSKQIRYIRRNAARRSAEKIAGKLHLPVETVRKVIRKRKADEKDIGPSRERHADGWLSAALALLVFTAPFVFWKGQYEASLVPKTAVLQIGTLAILTAWLLLGVRTGDVRIRKSVLYAPAGLFLLWCWVSVGYAHNPYEAIPVALQWSIAGLLFFLVCNSSLDASAPRRLIPAVVLSGGLCALIGLGQFLFSFSWIPQVAPPAITFINKNMAAHFIVMAVPLAIVSFIAANRPARYWPAGIAASAMTVFLVYSRTRAGWVAAAVEALILAAFLIMEKRRARPLPPFPAGKKAAVVVCLVLVLALSGIGSKGIGSGFGEIADRSMAAFSHNGDLPRPPTTTSHGWRMGTWLNTLAMIRDHFWIGLGLGNHKIHYPLYHSKIVHIETFSVYMQLTNVHNDYLQTFAELGIVGMVPLVAFGFFLFRAVRRRMVSENGSSERFQTAGLVAGICGILTTAVFSFPFQRAVPPVLFMVYAGLLAGGPGSVRRSGSAESHFTGRYRILAAALLSVLATGWMVNFHVSSIRSDRKLLRVVVLDKKQNWKGIVREGKNVPWDNRDRLRILSYVGRAEIVLGRNREAIEALKPLTAAYPNGINYLFHLGSAYGNMGDFRNARRAFSDAVRIKPDFAQAHVYLAKALEKMGETDKALAAYRTASGLDPKNRELLFDIGMLEAKKGAYAQAAGTFRRILEIAPEWALAWKNLGALYYNHLDRRSEGIACLEKAIELDPSIDEADQIAGLIRQWRASRPVKADPGKAPPR